MISGSVAVALSGGVDSLVAAALLKRRFRQVIGLHFETGFESPETPEAVVAHLRSVLDIDVYRIDLREPFRRLVVEPFIRTYLLGKTPNPCLICNAEIKYGVLLSEARKRGAAILATGHYAWIYRDDDGQVHLHKGRDSRKDQSYFLSRISRDGLEQALFPLGNLTKEQVRGLAQRYGLRPFHRSESQDVCFIRGMHYGEFLVGQTGIVPERGEIVDVSGRVIGMHDGLWGFTIGQRRGLRCPASEPYYVLRLEPASNRIVVGEKEELLMRGCTVRKINWIEPSPQMPVEVQVKLRYRHTAVDARLIPGDPAVLEFHRPHPAVTPGQGAVFYAGDRVLGCGWIGEALPMSDRAGP
ncbi:MAG: tRNA 2-thiouridine(34) synthase MnmA [Thermodesulfobacteriota bacterium]